MKPRIGARVLITEDCRGENLATGWYGVYEGDFPLSVMLCYQENKDSEPVFVAEGYYDKYKSGEWVVYAGDPAKEIFIEWERGKECPLPHFAMINDNPRIRLGDGSVIWGAECWWCEAPQDIDLADAQRHTEITKRALVAMARELSTRPAAAQPGAEGE